MVDDFVYENTVQATTKKWFSVSKPTVRICAAAADTFMTLKTVLFEWNKLFAADRGYNHCPRKKRNNFILSICFGRCFFPEIRKFFLTTYRSIVVMVILVVGWKSKRWNPQSISVQPFRKQAGNSWCTCWNSDGTVQQAFYFFAMADWDDRVFTRDRKISRRMLRYKWS